MGRRARQAQETQEWPSHIHRVTGIDNNTNSTQRRGHLLGLLGYTQIKQGETRVLRVDKLYQSAATFLAWKHFEERDGSVLPQLPRLLAGCDFHWTYQARDTALEPMQAVRELVKATSANDDPYGYYPFAVAGPTYSKVAKQVSVLGAALELPQISGTTTSSALDASGDTSPLFSRTVPASNADAQAALQYLESLPSGVTHLGCVYINDSWGAPFHADLLRQANKRNITLVGAPYVVPDGNHQDYNTEEDVRSAMEKMAGYDLRYYVLLVYSRDWKTVFRAAIQQGIMGRPGYFWAIADSTLFFSDEFYVDRSTESDLARALNGLGILNRGLEPHRGLQTAMRGFSTSPTLQEEFYSKLSDPEQQFTNASRFSRILQEGYPGWDMYFAANYDAAMALGLAACGTPGLFTGPQLDATLRQLEFDGTSGRVRFHPVTGTRVASTAQFWMMNLAVSEDRSTETEIRFDHFRAATVRADPEDPNSMVVVQDRPYRYSDNTTEAPLALPPAQIELNLISSTARIVGWALASCTIALAILFLGLTLAYRKRSVVRAAQPVFLAQLCVGIVVMVGSVFPMSHQTTTTQESRDTLACMATPWLFCLGFAIAISALLAKAWRLSKLMASGRGMRRITVQPKDVILPFVVLVVLNIALLAAWAIVAPLAYERVWVETNIDVFGRRVESYGVCRSSGPSSAFAASLAVLNFLPVLVALYQCYTARSLPTQFSESKFLTLAIASIFETLCMGAPFLFLVSGRHPSAHYSVQSSLVCIIGATLLLVLFLPKFAKINEKQHQTGRAQTAMLSQAPMDASMHSMHSVAGSARGSTWGGSNRGLSTRGSNRGSMWGSQRKSGKGKNSACSTSNPQATRSSSQKTSTGSGRDLISSSGRDLNDSEIDAELCEIAMEYGDVRNLPRGMMRIQRTDG